MLIQRFETGANCYYSLIKICNIPIRYVREGGAYRIYASDIGLTNTGR